VIASGGTGRQPEGMLDRDPDLPAPATAGEVKWADETGRLWEQAQLTDSGSGQARAIEGGHLSDALAAPRTRGLRVIRRGGERCNPTSAPLTTQ
jgi:hypothetical protein